MYLDTLFPELSEDELKKMEPAEVSSLYLKKQQVSQELKKIGDPIDRVVKERMQAGETFPGLALDVTQGAKQFSPSSLYGDLQDRGLSVDEAMGVMKVSNAELTKMLKAHNAKFTDLEVVPTKQKLEFYAEILRKSLGEEVVTQGEPTVKIFVQDPSAIQEANFQNSFVR